MLVQGRLLSFSDDLSEPFYIRKQVFAIECNRPEEMIFDEYDSTSIHAVVYEGQVPGKAVATGRLVFDGEICELDNVAVLKEYRGKQLGNLIIRMLVNKAYQGGIGKVFTSVPPELVRLFQTVGFITEKQDDLNSSGEAISMYICTENLLTGCKNQNK
jgi:N-acetylglutamate synthase-like GNAT family acetyltransferase